MNQDACFVLHIVHCGSLLFGGSLAEVPIKWVDVHYLQSSTGMVNLRMGKEVRWFSLCVCEHQLFDVGCAYSVVSCLLSLPLFLLSP